MKTPDHILNARHERKEAQIISNTITAGIIVSLSFIAFFLVMYAFGLGGMLELRSVNGVFLFAGIYWVIRHFRNKHGKIDYLKGMRLGLRTTAYAVIPFAVFMFFFLHYSPEFMTYIRSSAWSGDFMTPATAGGMILIEGLASGIIMSFILLMRYKKE